MEEPDFLLVANATNSTRFSKTRQTKLIIHDYNQTYSDNLLLRLKDGMQLMHFTYCNICV